MAQRRSTKTEIRSEMYRTNFEKFSTCQPLADDCTRGFYLKTGIQIVKHYVINAVVRQRLTHFPSFEHTQNVSIFGEGLYLLLK